MWAAPASAQRPLHTGFLDPGSFTHEAASFDKARSAGATRARLALFWVSVAYKGKPAAPSLWNAPEYNWPFFDRQVRRAVDAGLEPIVGIQVAPEWATATGTGHTERPNLAEFAAFVTAAANRYDGSKTAPNGMELPRVRYWQVWNEPNRNYSLSPQFDGAGRIVAADWYRDMVRLMGAAVRGVHADNQVVAGGLAPLGRRAHAAPLAFMRALLCVDADLKRTCPLQDAPVEFDVWAHHPYTPGAPTRKAAGRNDVVITGLPKMRKLLNAAIRLGHVRTRGPVELWATEFAWDTAPPDPQALPTKIHARWTAEALYRMWKAGVTTVTWFLVQDEPMRTSRYQSGLYTVAGKRKLSFRAFRFPVVAFPTKKGIQVWGRTPFGQRGRVQVLVKAGKRWRALGRLQTSEHGIFRATFRTSLRGPVQARFGREQSVPFSLKPVRDRYVEPFGSPLRP